jgi:hypothetical protein
MSVARLCNAERMDRAASMGVEALSVDALSEDRRHAGGGVIAAAPPGRYPRTRCGEPSHATVIQSAARR